MNQQLLDAIEESNRTYTRLSQESGISVEAILRAVLGLRQYFSRVDLDRLATILNRPANQLGLSVRQQTPARKTVKKVTRAGKTMKAPSPVTAAPTATPTETQVSVQGESHRVEQ